MKYRVVFDELLLSQSSDEEILFNHKDKILSLTINCKDGRRNFKFQNVAAYRFSPYPLFDPSRLTINDEFIPTILQSIYSEWLRELQDSEQEIASPVTDCDHFIVPCESGALEVLAQSAC